MQRARRVCQRAPRCRERASARAAERVQQDGAAARRTLDASGESALISSRSSARARRHCASYSLRAAEGAHASELLRVGSAHSSGKAHVCDMMSAAARALGAAALAAGQRSVAESAARGARLAGRRSAAGAKNEGGRQPRALAPERPGMRAPAPGAAPAAGSSLPLVLVFGLLLLSQGASGGMPCRVAALTRAASARAGGEVLKALRGDGLPDGAQARPFRCWLVASLGGAQR